MCAPILASVGPVNPPRLLLDENLSPSIARTLSREGYDVVHVRDRGLLQATDAQVFARAFDEDRIVVTSNCDDFKKLARAVAVHAGLVFFEDGGLLAMSSCASFGKLSDTSPMSWRPGATWSTECFGSGPIRRTCSIRCRNRIGSRHVRRGYGSGFDRRP